MIATEGRLAAHILVADDDPEDRLLTRQALSEAGQNATTSDASDGAEVMAYLTGVSTQGDTSRLRRPALVLLDLSMPKQDGFATLRAIRACADFRTLPVVVLTTSSAPDDITKAYALGANSYITKPFSFDELVTAMAALGEYWFGIVSLPESH